MKRGQLTRALLEESDRRREAENLLGLAQEQLAEGILRENTLTNRIILLEQKLREAGVQVP